MANDEYEILPHSSIDRLKSDLEALKQKTSSGGDPKETLQAINDLKESIDSLLKLFKTASEEMKMEEAETHGVEKKLGPLMKKVDMLIDQNQELARGLVVVADMIKDHLPKIEGDLDVLKHRQPMVQQHKPEPPKPPVRQKPVDFSQFETPMAPTWSQPRQAPMPPPGPAQRQAPMPPPGPAQRQAPMPPFGQAPQMPPLQGLPPLGAPEPLPGFEEDTNKSGLFGKLFKK